MAEDWNGSKWLPRTRRLALYSRDGFCCVYCGNKDNLTLDHLKPRSKGGDDADRNLITACKSCNSSRGDVPWWKFCDDDAKKRITTYRRRGTTKRLKLARRLLRHMSWSEVMYLVNGS